MTLRILLLSTVIMSTIGCRKDCTHGEFLDNVDAYNQGYNAGYAEKKMGGSMSCALYVDKYNYAIGRNVLFPTECFCQGYDDGFEGKAKAYKK